MPGPVRGAWGWGLGEGRGHCRTKPFSFALPSALSLGPLPLPFPRPYPQALCPGPDIDSARAEADRHGHHAERGGEHRGGAGVGRVGRRDPRRRRREHRRHGGNRAPARRACRNRGRGPATARRRTTPRRIAVARLDPVARRRRARLAGARDGDQRAARLGAVAGAAIACRASPVTSAAGSAAPTGIRTTSCASTIGAPAQWNGRRVHESVASNGEPGRLAHELQHFAYRDIAITSRRSIATRRSRREQMRAEGRRAVARRPRRCTRRSPSCATTSCAAGSATAAPACRVGANSVLRLPETREAVGARPRSAVRRRDPRLRRPRTSDSHLATDVLPAHRHGADVAGRAEPGAAHGARPARARATATMLVAHAAGELRQRAKEGLELVPLAPKTEMDLGAAWRLSRLIKQLAARHRARARSARRRDGGAGAVDEHAAGQAAAGRGAPRRLPPARATRCRDGNTGRWTASSARPRRSARCCVADGVPAAARRHRARRHRSRARRRGAAGEAARGALAAARRAARRQRRGAGAAQGPAPPDRGGARSSSRRCRTRGSSSPAKASCAPALERQIKDRHLEKHVLLAGFRPDVLSVHKAFDVFVMSSVTEGLGTSLLDAMACGKPIVATTAGGIPEVVVDGETGFLVPPRDHEAMADAIVTLLQDDAAAARDGRRRPGARARRASAPSGWCRTRCASTAASRCTRMWKREWFRAGALTTSCMRHQPRPAARMIRGQSSKVIGGAVGGEGHAAGDAARRESRRDR